VLQAGPKNHSSGTGCCGGLWLHGGYSTYYPYKSTENLRTQTPTSKSFAPYGGYAFYHDDLWFFGFTKPADSFGGHIHYKGGQWRQVKPIGSVPAGRMEHTVVLSNSVLILQAGFALNYHLNDTWYYNITTNRWLEKGEFEQARYPSSCSEDEPYITDDANKCFPLRWPREKSRSAYYPFEVLNDRQQDWYAPDFSHINRSNTYYGILDKGAHIETGRKLVHNATAQFGGPGRFGARAPDGPPLVPYAQTGPRQWVRNVSLDEAVRLGMLPPEAIHDANTTR
jgi:hypothetical protein